MGKRKRNLDITKISRNVDLAKAMKEEQVIYGLVTSTISEEKYGEPAFMVETDGKKALLLKSELGYIRGGYPAAIVGRILSFCVISKNEQTDIYMVSHKKASQILAQPLIKDMKEFGFTQQAIVRNILPQGVYVTLAGGVWGFIPQSEIWKELQKGQEVKVKYNYETNTGLIQLSLMG